MSMLSVADAQSRMLSLVTPLTVETVTLDDAVGRYAAADIAALRTQPAADLSSMDGYAIRHADLPGPFALIGESAAGRPFAKTVGAGETVRIFTGAAMPTGADCVLVQEEAAVDGKAIRLAGGGPPRLGSSVRSRGLDFVEGDGLVAGGERLTPARVALAAIAGHASLPVRRRVRVAIAATGDELVPPGTPLGEGQLPEANGVMLAGVLAGQPVELVDLGILPDRLDALRDAFAGVVADVLVTSGGASVGDHDLVRPALEAAGGDVAFWRVALRPGKPLMTGRLGGTIVLGLPGNPVSAFVTATLFVKPLVAALAGARDPRPATLAAILGEALPANDGRADYLRGRLRDGRAFASPVQDSSMLRVLADSDCLILRPPHAPAALPGDAVRILPIA